MNRGIFHRAELLLGKEKLSRVSNTRVIIFGVGGVGSWCAESLIRSGIKHLTIVDSDRVCVTNINRQLQATSSSIGKVKVQELKKRLLDINPEAEIEALQKIYSPETMEDFNLKSYDYIIDAIDSMSKKIHLIETCLRGDMEIFSSMGAALKLDPSKIKIASIWKTERCPLARKVRKALRAKKITRNFQCVYSDEIISEGRGETYCGNGDCSCSNNKSENSEKPMEGYSWTQTNSQANGSISHITAIFGFMIAGMVIESIAKK